MTKDKGAAGGRALQSHNEVMTRRNNKQQILQVKQLPPPQPQVVLRSSSPTRPSSSSRPSPQMTTTTTSSVVDIQLKQHVSNAPPAQVFTRGSFGAVKTRPSSHGGSSTAGSIDETSSRGSSAGGGGGRRPHRSTSRNKTIHRSHSQDPKNNNRQGRRNSNPNSVVNGRNGRVRSRMATSQYPPQPTRTSSRTTSVVVVPRSNGSVISSTASEDQNSVHSAPSVYRSNSNPEWRSSGFSNPAVVEWREPISSRQGSPSIIKQQQQQQHHHNGEHSSSSHQHQTTMRDISPGSNKSAMAEDSQKNFMRTTKRVVEGAN